MSAAQRLGNSVELMAKIDDGSLTPHASLRLLSSSITIPDRVFLMPGVGMSRQEREAHLYTLCSAEKAFLLSTIYPLRETFRDYIESELSQYPIQASLAEFIIVLSELWYQLVSDDD